MKLGSASHALAMLFIETFLLTYAAKILPPFFFPDFLFSSNLDYHEMFEVINHGL